jgi:predicted amidohydrolase
MRVHVLQVGYGDDESVQERVERVAVLVREQAGADLVVLPELWAHGGFDYRTWAERAETVDGPTTQAMAKAARDAGVVLHAGSIVERMPADAGPDADRGPQGGGCGTRPSCSARPASASRPTARSTGSASAPVSPCCSRPAPISWRPP